MARARCVGCGARPATGAAFCATCGRSNAPVALEDVSFTDTEATTVELGGQPGGRWRVLGAVVAIAAVVAGLAVAGSGDETVSQPAPPTTGAPATSTSRPAPSTTTPTTAPDPTIENFGPLIPGVTTGRRLAVLGDGEIRTVDIDTGRAVIAIREVHGDTLTADWDGVFYHYIVRSGDVVTRWTRGEAVEFEIPAGVEYLDHVGDDVAVTEWIDGNLRVRVLSPTGSAVVEVDSPRDVWTYAVASPGVLAQSVGNGVYLIGWDGTTRRVAPGRVVGLLDDGVQTLACDDAFDCVVESRSWSGELLASAPATQVDCCNIPRPAVPGIAVLERNGVSEIVPLDGIGAPIPTNSVQQTVAWWPDGQAMVMFDGTVISVFDLPTRTVHRLQLPGDFRDVVAVAPIV